MGRTLIVALVAGALVIGFGGGILGAFLFRQDISPLETEVGTLEGQLQAAAGDVTTLETQVNDLGALVEDVATLRSQINYLEGRLQAAAGNISALEAQVNDLRALAEDVAALGSQIDSLEGRLQGVEGDIAALEAQLSAAEERLRAVEEDPPTF
jgi:chromosome segregation ATPase